MTNADAKYVEYARQCFTDPEKVRKAERDLAERLKIAQLAKLARDALQAAGMKVLSKSLVHKRFYHSGTSANPLQMM